MFRNSMHHERHDKERQKPLPNQWANEHNCWETIIRADLCLASDYPGIT